VYHARAGVDRRSPCDHDASRPLGDGRSRRGHGASGENRRSSAPNRAPHDDRAASPGVNPARPGLVEPGFWLDRRRGPDRGGPRAVRPGGPCLGRP